MSWRNLACVPGAEFDKNCTGTLYRVCGTGGAYGRLLATNATVLQWDQPMPIPRSAAEHSPFSRRGVVSRLTGVVQVRACRESDKQGHGQMGYHQERVNLIESRLCRFVGRAPGRRTGTGSSRSCMYVAALLREEV